MNRSQNQNENNYEHINFMVFDFSFVWLLSFTCLASNIEMPIEPRGNCVGLVCFTGLGKYHENTPKRFNLFCVHILAC